MTETQPVQDELRAAPPPTGPRTVGRVLRRARQRRGWSIREVERRTGLSNTWLSQVERGIIQKPDPAALWRLASILGLNFALLLKWVAGEESTGAGSPMAGAAIQAFLALSEDEQAQALEFLQNLAGASDSTAEVSDDATASA